MKILKCFTLLVLMFCCGFYTKAAGPGLGDKKSTEGSIQGYVLDAVTRKPVTGVTVSLQGSKSAADQAMQSDASGYFKFGKLPIGDVTLMFEKKGYKIYKSDVQSIKEGAIKMNIEVQPLDEEDFETWHPLRKFMDLD